MVRQYQIARSRMYGPLWNDVNTRYNPLCGVYISLEYPSLNNTTLMSTNLCDCGHEPGVPLRLLARMENTGLFLITIECVCDDVRGLRYATHRH